MNQVFNDHASKMFDIARKDEHQLAIPKRPFTDQKAYILP